jgi:hypothetical protein
MNIEIQDSDREFLAWALELAAHNTRWSREAAHSSDAERDLARLREEGLTRVARAASLVDAGESPHPQCVVTNVSDLTPAMRAGVLSGNLRDCPAATRDALLRRGLATGRPGHYRLTEAGRRARTILESHRRGVRS